MAVNSSYGRLVSSSLPICLTLWLQCIVCSVKSYTVDDEKSNLCL